MKKEHLLDSVLSGLRAALQHWSEQGAAMQAMEKVYVRKWRMDDPETDYAIHILINPHGSIYQVTQRHYVNGNLLREESYPAGYWHSSGRLVGFGKQHYLLFDPVLKVLYLEDWTLKEPRLEIYEQL